MAEQVYLREKGKEGSGKPFDPKHAKAVLAYPGSAWEEVPAEVAAKAAEEPKAIAAPKAGSGAKNQ